MKENNKVYATPAKNQLQTVSACSPGRIRPGSREARFSQEARNGVPNSACSHRRILSAVRSYSPYGTQIFFTCVACSRNQRPSPTFVSNQSIARPSFVQTCFRFPIDIAFADATVASSP